MKSTVAVETAVGINNGSPIISVSRSLEVHDINAAAAMSAETLKTRLTSGESGLHISVNATMSGGTMKKTLCKSAGTRQIAAIIANLKMFVRRSSRLRFMGENVTEFRIASFSSKSLQSKIVEVNIITDRT